MKQRSFRLQRLIQCQATLEGMKNGLKKQNMNLSAKQTDSCLKIIREAIAHIQRLEEKRV